MDASPRRGPPRLPEVLNDTMGQKRRKEHGKENITAPEAQIALKSTPERKRARLSGPPKPPRTSRVSLGVEDTQVKQLQAKIDHECLMRDGTVKLLQASTNERQAIHASKTLFVCNTKILTLMSDLQKAKAVAQGGTERRSQSDPNVKKPCKAKIALTDIRIPLEWKEFESRKGKLDPTAVYHVFCLFKMGHEVVETRDVVEVDRTTADIVFDGTIHFSELVDPSFQVEVEVYCAIPNEEEHSTKPSTPSKFNFRKIRKDHSDSPSSNGAAHSGYTTRFQSTLPTHRFAIAGHTMLSLKDIASTTGSFPLKKGAVGSSGTAATGGGDAGPLLPLWGQFSCRLMAQPECATSSRASGFINVQQMVSGLPNWLRLWTILRQNQLRCWTFPEDVGSKMPVFNMTLTEVMTVENAPRLSIRRPNALVVKGDQQEQYIAFESKEERDDWAKVLDQAIVDLQHWGSSCSFIIPEPDSRQTKRLAEHKQVPPPVQPAPLPARPSPTVQAQHRSAVTSRPISQPATQTELREATAAKQVSKLVNATKTPLALVLDPIDNSYGTVKANETFL